MAKSTAGRIIGRIILILILASLSLFGFWRASLAYRVSKEFDEIRATGLPATAGEINQWLPAVPDAENGALVLADAFSLLQTNSTVYDPARFLYRTNQWTDEDRQNLRAYVATNAPALAKIREAMPFKRFRYPLDFSFGPDTQLPHLAKLKQIATLACLQSVFAIEDQKNEAIPDGIEIALKMATTLDDEPVSISFLVRSAILRLPTTTLERILNQSSLPEETCRRLQQLFSETLRTNTLPAVLVGERALSSTLFRMSRKEMSLLNDDPDGNTLPRPPQRYSGKPFFGNWLHGFFERDLEFFLKTMDQSISLAALPPPQNLALTNQLEQAALTAGERFYFFSGMLLPSLSRLSLRDVSTTARINVTKTALAVERFRSSRGSLPPDLNALVPDFIGPLPDDPFNTQPLHYRKTDRGYTIYSLDADGTDNHGKDTPPHQNRGPSKGPFDIAFTIERRQK